MMNAAISEWCDRQRRLLLLEREEENEQLTSKLETLTAKECEESGISVLSLVLAGVSVSLYGRSCLTLERKDRKVFPNHSLKVGDEAGNILRFFGSMCSIFPILIIVPLSILLVLRGKGGSMGNTVRGVIAKVTSISIDLVTDSYDDDEMDTPLRLDQVIIISSKHLHRYFFTHQFLIVQQLASDATFKKMNHALNDLETLSHGPAWPIANIIFNGGQIEVRGCECS